MYGKDATGGKAKKRKRGGNGNGADDPALRHVRLLRAPGVADLLAVNVSTVWRLAARVKKPLSAVKLGGCTRFKLADIEKFIEEATEA